MVIVRSVSVVVVFAISIPPLESRTSTAVFVSMASPEPMLVAPIRLIVPEVATMSTSVSPPSTIAASAVTVTAEAVLFVVVNSPTVISPELAPVDVNVRVPLPASMVDPSVMAIASLPPAKASVLDWRDMFPAPLAVILPDEEKLIASSAVRVTAPPEAIVTTLLIFTSDC